MTNQTNNNQFRDDEIVIMSHWDKKEEKWVKNIYPKVGGRLRLAHDANEQLSITTEIIRYDENIAVVRAVTSTMKGTFPGIGMASVERDHSIAPAILELAETRAIARSLRFSGYGVEYCSAEEVSHLQNGGNNSPPQDTPQANSPQEGSKTPPDGKSGNGGNDAKGEDASDKGSDGGENPGDEGNGRLTSKQYKFIMKLTNDQGMTRKEVNDKCIKVYGVAADYLTKTQASALIDELIGQ